MKYQIIFILLSLFWVSCNEHPKNTTHSPAEKEEVSAPNSTESAVTTLSTQEIVPGEYYEYYPNGTIKIKGTHDKELLRDGLWISYYENGTKWSECYYTGGKREGHSLTFYPNGKVRYVGEYKNDKQFGKWTFYDEKGNITKETSY